jgi:hypothetical protein
MGDRFDSMPERDWFEGVESRVEDAGDGYVRLPASDWQGVASGWKMSERYAAALRGSLEGLVAALDRMNPRLLSLNVRSAREIAKTVLARQDWFRE